MKAYRKIMKSLSVALVPLVMALAFVSAVFVHVHRLPNGVLIVHSHPYQAQNQHSGPFGQHQHNDSDCIILSQLFAFQSLTGNMPALLIEPPVYGALIQSCHEVHYAQRVVDAGWCYRGPPQCSISFCFV